MIDVRARELLVSANCITNKTKSRRGKQSIISPLIFKVNFQKSTPFPPSKWIRYGGQPMATKDVLLAVRSGSISVGTNIYVNES